MNDKLILTDQSKIERIEKKVDELHELIKNGAFNQSSIGKYVSETEAKKLLGKGTTWFWEQRTKGTLKHSKVGATNYYKIEDLEKFIEDNYSQ